MQLLKYCPSPFHLKNIITNAFIRKDSSQGSILCKALPLQLKPIYSQRCYKKHMKAELREPYVQNLPKLENEIKASQGNLKELSLNMKLEM